MNYKFESRDTFTIQLSALGVIARIGIMQIKNSVIVVGSGGVNDLKKRIISQ